VKGRRAYVLGRIDNKATGINKHNEKKRIK
jgi:hypothetical protein